MDDPVVDRIERSFERGCGCDTKDELSSRLGTVTWLTTSQAHRMAEVGTVLTISRMRHEQADCLGGESMS